MRVVVAILSVLLLTGVLHASESAPDPEDQATRIDLKVADLLLQLGLDQLELEGEDLLDTIPRRPMPLRTFAKRLPTEIQERIPVKDAWGTDLKIARGARFTVLVASAGRDGDHDLLEAVQRATVLTKKEEMELELPALHEIIGDDIVLVVGKEIVDGRTAALQQQRRAMADLRSLGTAIESYSIDHNVYPVQDIDLLPVDVIEDKLTPVYIRTIPRVDPWGNNYLMWGTEGDYCVLSRGADGRFDQYYGFVHVGTDGFQFEGATRLLDADIVFCYGQFVQWPEGTQQ